MKLTTQVSCLLIACGLLTYTILRAFHLSFTHDESFSYLYCSRDSFMEIISNRTTVISSNNHILNTLSMKFFEALFGSSEIVLRLQSIIAHIVYLIFTWLLLKPLRSQIIILAGFILLNVNPYLLEFFSLARGYALAIAFMLIAIYYFIQFVQDEKQKYIVYALIAACFSVISNFGLFYFFGTMLILYEVVLFIKYKNIRIVFSKNKPVFIILVCMFAFCYEPMRKLIIGHQFSFGGETGFWQDTVSSSIYAYLNNEVYQNENTIVTAIQSIIVLTLIMYAALLFYNYSKNKFTVQNKTGVVFISILGSIVLMNIIMHTLVNSPFINDRFALFIVPLFMFVVIFFLDELMGKKIILKAASTFLLLCFSSAMLYHFSRCCNMAHTMNWRYDASTKTMINDLITEKEITKKEKIKLGITWEFEPAINFYRVTKKLDWLEKVNREGITAGYDYYYVEKDDFAKADSLHKIMIKAYPVPETRFLK